MLLGMHIIASSQSISRLMFYFGRLTTSRRVPARSGGVQKGQRRHHFAADCRRSAALVATARECRLPARRHTVDDRTTKEPLLCAIHTYYDVRAPRAHERAAPRCAGARRRRVGLRCALQAELMRASAELLRAHFFFAPARCAALGPATSIMHVRQATSRRCRR